ncbi:MAG: EamA family transporter RarD [Desulfobacterales bacterium]|nr:EamA family transporter RarD [Desulfobacterales bacterium]
MTRHTPSPIPRDSLAGLAAAVPAYLIWGLSPAYWKTLVHVPAFEILMHRMIWSFVFLVPLVIVLKQWKELKEAITNTRTLAILTLTTVIVGGNWFLFIWAINSGHILQTSLGYYINPLVNVLLGMIFLGERLRPLQAVAVGLAAISVTYLTLGYGTFPWVALALAVTFGFYALIRKVAPVGAAAGLTIETLLLSLPAAAYLFYLDMLGKGAFLRVDTRTDLLLMGAALVTALPLLLFTLGARRLPLATMGFLQYLAPSCSFVLAVTVYEESLAIPQILSFVLIWVALLIFSVDSVRFYRNRPVTR